MTNNPVPFDSASNWYYEMSVFKETENRRNQGKPLRALRTRTNNKLTPYMKLCPGIPLCHP